MAVVADDRDAVGGKMEIDALEIPEIADGDAVEADPGFRCLVAGYGWRGLDHLGGHLPLKAGGRFSMNARVPSRMSSVAARRPK